jgi:hypothetical protein
MSIRNEPKEGNETLGIGVPGSASLEALMMTRLSADGSTNTTIMGCVVWVNVARVVECVVARVVCGLDGRFEVVREMSRVVEREMERVVVERVELVAVRPVRRVVPRLVMRVVVCTEPGFTVVRVVARRVLVRVVPGVTR